MRIAKVFIVRLLDKLTGVVSDRYRRVSMIGVNVVQLTLLQDGNRGIVQPDILFEIICLLSCGVCRFGNELIAIIEVVNGFGFMTLMVISRLSDTLVKDVVAVVSDRY